jgi:hypothetical protein
MARTVQQNMLDGANSADAKLAVGTDATIVEMTPLRHEGNAHPKPGSNGD